MAPAYLTSMAWESLCDSADLSHRESELGDTYDRFQWSRSFLSSNVWLDTSTKVQNTPMHCWKPSTHNSHIVRIQLWFISAVRHEAVVGIWSTKVTGTDASAKQRERYFLTRTGCTSSWSTEWPFPWACLQNRPKSILYIEKCFSTQYGSPY